MAATVIIRYDSAHLYAFPAAHITRIWSSGDILNIALADSHPHHKLRLTETAAHHLVRGLSQAIAYYEREAQTFTIDVDQDGDMQVTATMQSSREKELTGS